MSKEVSWDNLMNTIDNTWSYDILGKLSDNYLLTVDTSKINEIEDNKFRKRKYNECKETYSEFNFTPNRFKI